MATHRSDAAHGLSCHRPDVWMPVAARTRSNREFACGCEMTDFTRNWKMSYITSPIRAASYSHFLVSIPDALKHPKTRINVPRHNVSSGSDVVLGHHGIVQPRYQLPDYPRLLADVGRSTRFLTSGTFAALMSTLHTYIDDMFRSSLLCASNQGRHPGHSTCDMLLEHAVEIKRWPFDLFLA